MKTVKARMLNLTAIAAVLSVPEIANQDADLGNDLATFYNDTKRNHPFDEMTAITRDERRGGVFVTTVSVMLGDPAFKDQVERLAKNHPAAIDRLLPFADQLQRARRSTAPASS
ncbi:MAG TPA: hypothetical protein PK109_00160 [Candidatus Paceibacterota bacterium]|nr:hypothetical protein [Candidatus Paceibacterota bacterium]